MRIVKYKGDINELTDSVPRFILLFLGMVIGGIPLMILLINIVIWEFAGTFTAIRGLVLSIMFVCAAFLDIERK